MFFNLNIMIQNHHQYRRPNGAWFYKSKRGKRAFIRPKDRARVVLSDDGKAMLLKLGDDAS
tara:strand:- start:69 stop:251 length:183 start_codon:yes stop_codon:yes gene_type:complete